MRAREPDVLSHTVRDGLKLGYEITGDGSPTILLMPTWTIIHSRFWKFQVPYLSRFYRVITYDGPGNGRSDRTVDPNRYLAESYAEDAAAVLRACDADTAIVVGMSLGAAYGLRLATAFPEMVSGLAFVGPSLPLAPPSPERAVIADTYTKPYPPDVHGWGKYNVQYWHDHYHDFTEFFFGECFSEPHSTKAIDDSVDWAKGAGPGILEAEGIRRPSSPAETIAMLQGLTCPLLVVHGTDDRIQPHLVGETAANLGGGTLVSFEGSGHIPNVRDPIPFNRTLREFIESVGP